MEWRHYVRCYLLWKTHNSLGSHAVVLENEWNHPNGLFTILVEDFTILLEETGIR